MCWLGVGGLAEGLKDLKGPVLWASLLPLTLPLGPKAWPLSLQLLPPQRFPLSLSLNPGVRASPGPGFQAAPQLVPILAERPGSSLSSPAPSSIFLPGHRPSAFPALHPLLLPLPGTQGPWRFLDHIELPGWLFPFFFLGHAGWGSWERRERSR